MTTPTRPPVVSAYADATALPPAVPIDMGLSGAGGLVTSLPGLLLGWTIREETGTGAAQVVLRNGSDTSGQRISETSLAAGASETVPIPPPGVLFADGLYADVRAGTVHGVIWWIPITSSG